MTKILLNPLELRQTAALLDASERELERYAGDFRHPPRPELTPAIEGAVEGGLRRAAHDCELLALQLEKEAQGLKRRAARVELDLSRQWARPRLSRPAYAPRPRPHTPAWYARYNKPLQETNDLDFLFGPFGIVKSGARRAGGSLLGKILGKKGSSDVRAATKGARAPDEGYHYTFGKVVQSIEKNGLRPGSYATTRGNLSPLQAQIDLALPPNRGLRDTVVRVDLAG